MIYVDDPTEYVTTLRYKLWSHMVTDTCELDLLCAGFLLFGHVRYFQDKNIPHFDLIPSMRKKAIKNGAKPVTSQELIKLTIRKHQSEFTTRQEHMRE